LKIGEMMFPLIRETSPRWKSLTNNMHAIDLFGLVLVPIVHLQDLSYRTIRLPKYVRSVPNLKSVSTMVCGTLAGTIVSGPYQFDDEMQITARWEVILEDGDREFISSDELDY